MEMDSPEEEAAAMEEGQIRRLQFLVFALVWAAFTTIYITQPVLPVLQAEFGVSETRASLSISAVILGIALANLPFGALADRFPVRPIILTGGLVITACGIICSLTRSLWVLVGARFLQGLFVPALTTCLVAYLARSLPVKRLNVVMGAYVSATVAGGLSGRLLGGWLHPPLHWRYAFVSASLFLMVAVALAFCRLPREGGPNKAGLRDRPGFLALLSRWDLIRIYAVGFGAFFVFSSVFNYLPFHLAGPPFHAPTQWITFLYLSYIVGIFTGPLAGRLSDRWGNGAAMVFGAGLFALAIGMTLIPSYWAVAVSLAGLCAGFFTVHASAAGSLNRKLSSSRGRANSLYVLFYYLGGTAGITLSGQSYVQAGWFGVVLLGWTVLLIPILAGLAEMRSGQISR